MPDGNDIPTLRRILRDTKSVAVVGLSANWYRPSFFAAKYLIDHGYQVIPVTPAYEEVLGEPCVPSVRELPEAPDVVDCFRRAEEIPAIAEQAVAVGAKVLWMQLGIVNEEAARIARDGGARSGDGPLHEDRVCAPVRRAQLRRGEHADRLRQAPAPRPVLSRTRPDGRPDGADRAEPGGGRGGRGRGRRGSGPDRTGGPHDGRTRRAALPPGT